MKFKPGTYVKLDFRTLTTPAEDLGRRWVELRASNTIYKVMSKFNSAGKEWGLKDVKTGSDYFLKHYQLEHFESVSVKELAKFRMQNEI